MTAIKKVLNLRGILWVIVVLQLGCTPRPASLFPEGNDIFGLASFIELQGDETEVILNDYFHSESVKRIDSGTAHPSLRARISNDGSKLYLTPRSLNIPHYTEVRVWLDGKPYSLITRKSVRQEHTFAFDPEGIRYRNVAIRGEMTDWIPQPMTLVDGKWQLTLSLNPGRYQYLIVANGKDMLDPANPEKVSNNAGGYNSLIEIGNTDRSLLPRIYATGYKGNDINLQLVNEVDKVIALWENFRIPEENLIRHGQHMHLYIPGDAFYKERSFIRVLAYNRHGAANDLLIPLHKGLPVTNPEELTREDREATIMYFLMVDRFFNGNPDRDDPVDDPEVADRANYHGGDLDGVLQKIREGYFTNLGVNAVWFSPITQNPLEAYIEFPEPKRKYTGYHGYWPITLTTIDHRFGDDKVLEKLVKSAHEREISVLLDFVSNHVHKNNPLIIENPHWKTTLDLPDGRQNIRIWDEHRLTTWFDDFLPSLDFSNPEVVETMVDSAFYWIDRFNLDGFRHDATKHVPFEFWRALTKKLKEEKMYPENKRLFQIGETFGSHDLISSYIGSGLLDGKFDFNLYWDARAVFALDDEPFERLDYSLHQSFGYYGFQNLMGNITGNHDMPRFISYAGGDLSFEEDDTESGWERTIGVGDPVGYDKLSSLTAFIMTIPGIPVIYYGDEIGIPGANDPDSRRPMIFEDLTENQQKVKENLKKLTQLRSSNMAFVYGDFNTLKVTDDVYAYSRFYFGNRAIVVFNKSREPKTVTVDLLPNFMHVNYTSHFNADFYTKGDKLNIVLAPNSFEVLTY
jgi:cyclomaltodextrinase / maltogenic alpha-amylase / neopullulanase